MSSQFFWFERSFTGWIPRARCAFVGEACEGRKPPRRPQCRPCAAETSSVRDPPTCGRRGRRRRAKSARIGSISSVPRPVRRGARVRRGVGTRPRSRGRRSTSRTRVAFRVSIQNGAKPPTSGTRRSREVRRRGARPKSPTPRPNCERKQRILSANTRICAGSEVCRLTAVRERPTSARGDEARERWV